MADDMRQKERAELLAELRTRFPSRVLEWAARLLEEDGKEIERLHHIRDKARQTGSAPYGWYAAMAEQVDELVDRAEKAEAELARIRKERDASSRVDELRKHWLDFCDADPVPEGFADRMENAGFIEMREVTEDDLREPFAAERGIEEGGTVWHLTDAGRKALSLAPTQREQT